MTPSVLRRPDRARHVPPALLLLAIVAATQLAQWRESPSPLPAAPALATAARGTSAAAVGGAVADVSSGVNTRLLAGALGRRAASAPLLRRVAAAPLEDAAAASGAAETRAPIIPEASLGDVKAPQSLRANVPLPPPLTAPRPAVPDLLPLPAPSMSTAPEPPSRVGEGRRAFIFTMDSLTGYVRGAQAGGAAGELAVREGLMWALRELGFAVDVADSDEAMERLVGEASGGGAAAYSLFFFDQWTVTDRLGRLRPFLAGRERALFVLSFFDWAPAAAGLPTVAQAHVLTAYPDDDGGSGGVGASGSGSTFLGFVVEENPAARGANKSSSGVVWGKRAAYLEGREVMLGALAAEVQLDFVVAAGEDGAARAAAPAGRFHGALRRDEWLSLLASSRFLLGLGNPLLGPSAMDALAAGAMYIDPAYDGARTRPLVAMSRPFASQHPYLRRRVGAPHVCEVADVTRLDAVLSCVRRALETRLEPFVDPDFTRAALLRRVRAIASAGLVDQ